MAAKPCETFLQWDFLVLVVGGGGAEGVEYGNDFFDTPAALAPVKRFIIQYLADTAQRLICGIVYQRCAVSLFHAGYDLMCDDLLHDPFIQRQKITP